SRQLRADDRSGHRGPAYGPHDEPRAAGDRRSGRRSDVARRRCAQGCGTDDSFDARRRAAARDDGRGPSDAGAWPVRRLTTIGVALLASSGALGAQDVGHPPSRSPYRDLMYRQELALFGGYFAGSDGKAGVAPSGGPAFGLRYEIRIGGPAHFTARLTHVR